MSAFWNLLTPLWRKQERDEPDKKRASEDAQRIARGALEELKVELFLTAEQIQELDKDDGMDRRPPA